MVRAAIVTGLLVGLGLLAVGFQWFSNGTPAAKLPECNLLAGACDWQEDAGNWQVTLTPEGEGAQGTEYRLTVTAPAAPSRFLAVLRGESMYMGEYPVPLQKLGPGSYGAVFTAPFCTTGASMVWRIDLQSGQEKLGNVPHALVFQADK